MKEIRAYVRPHMLDKVLHGLEELGFTDITVADLRTLRQGLQEEDVEYSVELAARYMRVVKLALVVRNRDVATVSRIIAERARTGVKGDGLIYVSNVETAIHIRTGVRGEQAVRSPGK